MNSAPIRPPLRKNPLVWVALAVVVGGTTVGLQGHFWIGIGSDVAGVLMALGAKLLSRRRDRRG